MEFEDLFRIYSHQLRHGCASFDCSCKECKSCKQFRFDIHDPSDYDLYAAELAELHDENPSLSENLPFLVTQNDSEDTLELINNTINHLISPLSVSDDDLCSIASIFSDPNVYTEILKENKKEYSDAFDVQATLLADLYEAIASKHEQLLPLFDLIQNPAEAITQTLKSDSKIYVDAILTLIVVHGFIDLENKRKILQLFVKLGEAQSKYVHESFARSEDLLKITVDFHIGILESMIDQKLLDSPYSKEAITVCKFVNFAASFGRGHNFNIPTSFFYSPRFSDNVPWIEDFALYMLPFIPRPTILRTPEIIPLEIKRKIILLETDAIVKKGEITSVNVRRNNIVEDAISQLCEGGKSVSSRLNVSFEGEQVQDDGGATQEFLYLVSKEVFDPSFGLMHKTENGTLWFNPAPEKMASKFKFLGQLVALALYNGVYLPIRLPKVIYWILLNNDPHAADLESIEPTLYRNIKKLITDLKSGKVKAEDVQLYFTVDVDGKEIELEKGGKNILVDATNCEKYLLAIANFYIIKQCSAPLKAFVDGFKLFQSRIFRSLHADEVDALVSGETHANWEDLEVTCRYDGYEPTDQTPKLFWKVFNELPEEKKVQFLFFLTGSDSVPVGGIGSIQMTIMKQNNDALLPTGHTCSNTLALPNYSSEDRMLEAIIACCENNTGFGVL